MPSSSASGYTALPVRVGARAFHTTIFARAHVSKQDDVGRLPAGRTLFVLNVPADVSADGLAEGFSARTGGNAPAVHLSDGGGSSDARSAHVVFEQAATLKKALNASKPLEVAHAENAQAGKSGASSAVGRASAPKRSALQSSVASFMEQFEAEEAARIAEEDARHNAMDADGFVVVSRKRTGRGNATDGTGAVVGVASAGAERHYAAEAAGELDGEAADPRRKKKRSKEVSDFYHFQQHEKKREGLLKLRAQFEADRERISKMRAERKFKPQGY